MGSLATQVKAEIITNEMISHRLFDIPTIQNQVAKWQLNFIGKVTSKSDNQIPTNLITVGCNNKQKVGGVLHSNNKNLLKKNALIVPTVD